ncbi:Flavinator of succinate dehydrogenase-domain-containing protein [Myxozyma melibiosi]|uniref:Succinate dehydrogenase assembly factor 2, mitochondrial n=1 Tax=Myxozyma melibiosi TaxID=54550 RepID=A0ABR1EY54_9ASCO
MQRTAILRSLRAARCRNIVNTATISRSLQTSSPAFLARQQQQTQKQEKQDGEEDENTVKIEFKLEPLPRINEPIENKRARLLYQSRKRGILETDLILSRFAATYLKEFNEAELEEYDKFLDEYDWDIYYWVTGNPSSPVPEKWQKSKILEMVKAQVEAFSKTEAVRMPEL